MVPLVPRHEEWLTAARGVPSHKGGMRPGVVAAPSGPVSQSFGEFAQVIALSADTASRFDRGFWRT